MRRLSSFWAFLFALPLLFFAPPASAQYTKSSDFRTAATGSVPDGWLDISSVFSVSGTSGSRYAGANADLKLLLAPDAVTTSTRLSLADGEVRALPGGSGDLLLVARVASGASSVDSADYYGLIEIGGSVSLIRQKGGSNSNPITLSGYSTGQCLGLKVVGNVVTLSRYDTLTATSALASQSYTDSDPISAAGGWGLSRYQSSGAQMLSVVQIGGLPYTTATGTVSGDAYKLYIPNGLANTTAAPLIIYCHGSGGDQNQFDLSSFDAMRAAFIAAGYRILAGNFAGEAWGNDAGQNAIEATTVYIRSNYNTPDTVLFGVSMGGLNGSLAAIKSRVPALRGVALNCPVLNLIATHDGNYTSAIETAFGGNAAYNAAKDSHNPLGLVLASPSNATHYLPFRFYVSTDDGTIPPADNADLFVPALVAPEKVRRNFTGGHVPLATLDATQAADMVAFFNRCRAGYTSTISSGTKRKVQ